MSGDGGVIEFKTASESIKANRDFQEQNDLKIAERALEVEEQINRYLNTGNMGHVATIAELLATKAQDPKPGTRMSELTIPEDQQDFAGRVLHGMILYMQKHGERFPKEDHVDESGKKVEVSKTPDNLVQEELTSPHHDDIAFLYYFLDTTTPEAPDAENDIAKKRAPDQKTVEFHVNIGPWGQYFVDRITFHDPAQRLEPATITPFPNSPQKTQK